MTESIEVLEFSEDKDVLSMDEMLQSVRGFIDHIASGEGGVKIDPPPSHKKLVEEVIEKLRPTLKKIRDEYKELAERGDATLEELGFGMSQLAPDVQEIVKQLVRCENLNEKLEQIGMYSSNAGITRVTQVIARIDNQVSEARQKYMNARLRLEAERMKKQLDKMKLEDQNLQTQFQKSEEEMLSKSQEQQDEEKKVLKKLVALQNSKTEHRKKTRKPCEVDNSIIFNVTQQFAEVKELRKQASELQRQLSQYEGLPPDIKLARRIVDEAKHQLLAENLKK